MAEFKFATNWFKNMISKSEKIATDGAKATINPGRNSSYFKSFGPKRIVIPPTKAIDDTGLLMSGGHGKGWNQGSMLKEEWDDATYNRAKEFFKNKNK